MKNENRDVVCQQCGNCCHVDVAAYVTADDMRLWEKEERHDVIAHVLANDVMWSGDKFVNRFGSNIETCRMSCIYLNWEGPSAFCRIYEVRTNVCRSYVPGSSNLCPQYDRKPG